MDQAIGGVRALAHAILDDTKEEAGRIVLQAQEAARQRLQQAKEEGDGLRREILTAAESEVSHMEHQAAAMARLDAQRIMLAGREALIDEVFSQAQARLSRLHEGDDYPTLLSKLIADAVGKMGSPPACVVRVAPRDLPLVTDSLLAQVAERWRGRVQLRLGEPVDITGGVIVQVDGGQRRYDNSLEFRLASERERLRAHVYRILQGGATW